MKAAKRQAKVLEAPETETIKLTAVVPPAHAPRFITQKELAEAFDVDERTILNWEEHGLPVDRRTQRYPRYPASDATTWAMEYRIRCDAARSERQNAPGPERLTVREAVEAQLRREARDLEVAPERYAILVPLEHDHPRRREMLMIAAQGIEPPSGCTCSGEHCPIHGG